MKKTEGWFSLVVLGLGLSVPIVAHASTKTMHPETQKDVQKSAKNYNKHLKKTMNKQAKQQRKDMKKFKKDHQAT